MRPFLSCLVACLVLSACGGVEGVEEVRTPSAQQGPELTALEQAIDDALDGGAYKKAIQLAQRKSRNRQEMEDHFRYIMTELSGASASGDQEALQALAYLGQIYSQGR